MEWLTSAVPCRLGVSDKQVTALCSRNEGWWSAESLSSQPSTTRRERMDKVHISQEYMAAFCEAPQNVLSTGWKMLKSLGRIPGPRQDLACLSRTPAYPEGKIWSTSVDSSKERLRQRIHGFSGGMGLRSDHCPVFDTTGPNSGVHRGCQTSGAKAAEKGSTWPAGHQF
ncbi:hypothetical protein GWK47_039942 [Chionoecetes opilio]|uniref:Uncharacterized protein n=1 Tax=Chionoecetes opilio TaxID=41210 RepID=A0A8J4YJU3_CHIOP|nr:hypothetical protein GWK47_039942 [Chionoecetes opilio]